MTLEQVGFVLAGLALAYGYCWGMFRFMLWICETLDRLCDWWTRRRR